MPIFMLTKILPLWGRETVLLKTKLYNTLGTTKYIFTSKMCLFALPNHRLALSQ